MRKALFIFLLFISGIGYAQITPVNVGTTANDRTGDPLRTAMQKLNANDTYLDKMGVQRLDSLISTGAGGAEYTASNGITLSGTDFQLGGTLVGSGVTFLGATGIEKFTVDINDGAFDGGWLNVDFRGVELGYKFPGEPDIAYGLKINGTTNPALSVVGFPLFYGSDMTNSILASGDQVIPNKAYVLGPKTYTDKQVFPGSGSGFSATAAINVSRAGDPGPAKVVNGDIWYNSSQNLLKARINGVTSTLLTGNGITNAGSGLTNSTGTVVLGGSVTQNTDLTPSSNNTFNFTLGGSSGNGYANIHSRSNAIRSYVDGTFEVLGASDGVNRLTVSASTPLEMLLNSSGFTVAERGTNYNSLSYRTANGFFVTNGSTLESRAEMQFKQDFLQVNFAGQEHLALTTEGLRVLGLQVDEGANATMGVATLVSGTATVNTNRVSTASRIFLTIQDPANPGTPYVSAKVDGASFTITSTSATDGSTVAWLIVQSF